MKPTVPVVLNLEERLLAALLEYCRQSGLPFEEAVPGLLTLSMERVLQARVSTDELDLIVQEALTFFVQPRSILENTVYVCTTVECLSRC